jgi:hypothetical protein
MLGDEEGEQVDVWHSLSLEPVPEILRLGKDVVPDPATGRKGGERRLGVEVMVEAEGEDGLGVSRPSAGRAPPTTRGGRCTWEVDGPAAPVRQQDLAGSHLPAAEEAALLSVLAAEQDDAALVFAALLPGGHDLRCLVVRRERRA